MIRYLFLLSTVLLLSPTHPCCAALFIDDTSTTDKGKPELGFGADYLKDVQREFDPETEEFSKTVSEEKLLYFSFYYGLSDNWDVGITLPYKFLEASSSFSDITLGTKYRWTQESRLMPSYALSLDMKIDNADEDKGFGSGKRDFSLNNILTKTFGNKIIDFNLGYTFVGGKPGDIVFYSFDLTYDLTRKVSLCNEIYGEKTSTGGFTKNVFCCGVSLSYQFTDLLSFDSGVGIGVTKVSPDYEVVNSLTVSF